MIDSWLDVFLSLSSVLVSHLCAKTLIRFPHCRPLVWRTLPRSQRTWQSTRAFMIIFQLAISTAPRGHNFGRMPSALQKLHTCHRTCSPLPAYHRSTSRLVRGLAIFLGRLEVAGGGWVGGCVVGGGRWTCWRRIAINTDARKRFNPPVWW